jgi:hypothetical protein
MYISGRDSDAAERRTIIRLEPNQTLFVDGRALFGPFISIIEHFQHTEVAERRLNCPIAKVEISLNRRLGNRGSRDSAGAVYACANHGIRTTGYRKAEAYIRSRTEGTWLFVTL